MIAPLIILQDSADLQRLADEMVRFADDNPFDREGVLEQMRRNRLVEKEEQGGFLHVSSSFPVESIQKYNRYASLGNRILQLTFYKMVMDGRPTVQLTVVDINKEPLTAEEGAYIAMFFIDAESPFSIADTPPHALVIIQEPRDAD